MMGFAAGGLLALIAWLVWRATRRSTRRFRRVIGAILAGQQAYFVALVQPFMTSTDGVSNDALERGWLMLPEWVAERGFSRHFQLGYTFFVEKLAQVGDTLFTLHVLARRQPDAAAIQLLSPELLAYTDQVNTVFTVLQALILQTESAAVGEAALAQLADCLQALEEKFRHTLPVNLEWLEHARDNVCLVNFLYTLEDLYWQLRRLMQALA